MARATDAMRLVELVTAQTQHIVRGRKIKSFFFIHQRDKRILLSSTQTMLRTQIFNYIIIET